MKERSTDIPDIFARQFREFEAEPGRDLWAAIAAGIATEPLVSEEVPATPQAATPRKAVWPWMAGSAAACVMLLLGWFLGQHARPMGAMAYQEPPSKAALISLPPIQNQTVVLLEAEPAQTVAFATEYPEPPEGEQEIQPQMAVLAQIPSKRPSSMLHIVRVNDEAREPLPSLLESGTQADSIPPIIASVAPIRPLKPVPVSQGSRNVLALDDPKPAQLGKFLVKEISKRAESPLQVENHQKGNVQVKSVRLRLPGFQIQRTTHIQTVSPPPPAP